MTPPTAPGPGHEVGNEVDEVDDREKNWRGVAADGRSDEITEEVSGLLRNRSRRLLTDLLRPHKKWIWILVAIVVVENASRLSIPYLVKEGIDKGIPPIRENATPACCSRSSRSC